MSIVLKKDWKKPCFFVFGLFCYLIVNISAKAQQVDEERTYLSIRSDISSSFIVIDNDSTTLQLISGEDLIEVAEGRHTITVFPKYVAAFTFTKEFQGGSYHVAEISFSRVLGEQNTTFTRLKNGAALQMINAAEYSGDIDGTISFLRYGKEEYREYLEKERLSIYRDTYLRVNSNVDSLFVQTKASPKPIYRIASGDSILIKPGFRFVRISHQYGREFSTTKQFKEGETTVINCEFELDGPTVATLSDNFITRAYYGANFIVVSDTDSEIYINREKVGTGAVTLSLEPGLVNLLVRNSLTGTIKKRIEHLPTENARVIGAYTKPSKSSAYALGIFPGASQIYKKQKLKSALIAVGFLAVSAMTITTHSSYQSKLSKYNRIEELYRNTTDEQQALEYGDFLVSQEQKIADLGDRRAIFLGAAALLYAFNWYDVITSTPKSGYRSPTNLKLLLKPQIFQNNSYSSVSLNYDF